jgi:hypothetical protein
VEPHTKHYELGVSKKRKVYSAKTCLSFLPRSSEMYYRIGTEETGPSDGAKIQCLPLYSLLLALDNPTVNYMSLDIEGGEFQILQSIPWDKVDIEVMTIESHFLGIRSPGTLEDLVHYLETKGYQHFPGAHQAKRNAAFELAAFEGAISEYITNELFVRKDIVA